jgi:hypothetical protein
VRDQETIFGPVWAEGLNGKSQVGLAHFEWHLGMFGDPNPSVDELLGKRSYS